MNNPLNKTDPSGYIWATLISYALNYIATTYATTAIGTAIGYALAAYQYYGYFQLAKGVVNAIEGGGTAMANFAGGFAKSYVKGMVEGAVIQGIGMALSSSKKQGGAAVDLKESESTKSNNLQEKGTQISEEDIKLGRRKLTPEQKKEFLGLLDESKEKIEDFIDLLNTSGSNSDYKAVRNLYGAVTERQFADTKTFLLEKSLQALENIEIYKANPDSLLANLDVIGTKGRWFGESDGGIGLNFRPVHNRTRGATLVHEIGHSIGLTHTRTESPNAFKGLAARGKSFSTNRNTFHGELMESNYAFDYAVNRKYK